MSYVILMRNPRNNKIVAVHDGDENIAIYDTEIEAEQDAHNVPACKAWPYAVVEAP